MRPTLAPEANCTLEGVTDAPTLEGACATPHRVHPGVSSPEISDDDLFGAFTNLSSALLMAWHYSGSNAKSATELNRLAEFLRDPSFKQADLVGFNHTRESKQLDDYLDGRSNPFHEHYGWQRSTVKIRLPNEKAKFPSETDAPELAIPGVYHRSLVDIITCVFEDDVSLHFNMTPFRQYWNTPDNRTLEVFSESYASPEMVNAYKELNALPRDPDDKLERVIASLMVWSDATHLASFGDASLWPLYLFFGNQSKYTRGKPTARACHHLAYIPNLPHNLQDVYVDIFGEPASSSTFTHLKREILLTSIKILGQRPCPRCLVKKTDIHMMGMVLDMRRRVTQEHTDSLRRRQRVEEARKLIFEIGAPVDGSRVKAILNEESYVPIRNTFSARLADHGIDMFSLFCAMAVFENLLPEPHNTIILDLLFDLASWHAYVKLRMHTTDTLDFFDIATTIILGQSVRKFYKTTCNYYFTTELPDEYAARSRREAALAAKQNVMSTAPGKRKAGPKYKSLNISTYKFHALGDYANTIRQRGTTDNYTTQPGELEHRHVKRWYPRTSKNKKTMVATMTRLEARERLVAKVLNQRQKTLASVTQQEVRKRTSPSAHYHISKYPKCSHDIFAWVGEHDDPAIKDFIPRLKDHLLARLRGIDYSGDEHNFSDEDRNQVIIVNNQLREHSVLRINYTTYDMRREQDSINPRTHVDVLMLSHENDNDRHPYWYARVVKIFDLDVWYRAQGATSVWAPTRMNVLFVRWFGRDIEYKAGWSAKRLYCIGFFKHDDPEGFGFVDPDQVIRGVHLIPGFEHGHTDTRLHQQTTMAFYSSYRALQSHSLYFYVNHFVDRDMFMRFRGGGVGHKVTREWDEFLRNDGAVPSHEEEDVQLDPEESDMEDEAVDDHDSDGSAHEDPGDDEENEVWVDEELDDDFLACEGYGAL
ncbi:hypothetical protein C8R48DRAFT_656144 [Suillus tomentosus]|nr:hypothetical protein C8R48DRAFT_656144 [Suillus tomentosus]